MTRSRQQSSSHRLLDLHGGSGNRGHRGEGDVDGPGTDSGELVCFLLAFIAELKEWMHVTGGSFHWESLQALSVLEKKVPFFVYFSKSITKAGRKSELLYIFYDNRMCLFHS